MNPKIHSISENVWMFHCPGCGYSHCVSVGGEKNERGASWDWNGSVDLPTFTPSILVSPDFPQARCHSFITDGVITYLADCHHNLAGKAVPLETWSELS